MANTLGLYDPLFYANEALIQLEKALGMAGRVYRGFEKSPQEKGSTINIRRPGAFTAQAMPISSVNTSDLTPESVAITLDQWFGVQFALTDKELAYTTQQIIDEHIRPAAVAVADKIDLSLCGLYKDVPWVYDASDPGAVTDFTGARQILFDNKVPLNDLHMMINGERENDYLSLSNFNEAQKSGTTETLRAGTLGRAFGFEIFSNQNVLVHTPGVAADATGAINGAVAAGATQLSFDGVTAAGTFKAGDSFSIAGDAQRYVFTADATADGTGAVANAAFAPALKADAADNAVITVRLAAKAENLAFHRYAFALAMAPLPDIGNQMGAKIATQVDPITGLALRSRMFYDGLTAKTYVSIDALWGVKTLDCNMAVRVNS